MGGEEGLLNQPYGSLEPESGGHSSTQAYLIG